MKYIESKEAASQGRAAGNIQTAGARLPVGGQQILQYQGSMPSLPKNPREVFNRSDLEATRSSKAYPTLGGRSAGSSYFNDASGNF